MDTNQKLEVSMQSCWLASRTEAEKCSGSYSEVQNLGYRVKQD